MGSRRSLAKSGVGSSTSAHLSFFVVTLPVSAGLQWLSIDSLLDALCGRLLFGSLFGPLSPARCTDLLAAIVHRSRASAMGSVRDVRRSTREPIHSCQVGDAPALSLIH